MAQITARKPAQPSLQNSDRLLRLVTSRARVGLVMVNRHYEYLFANEAYGEVLGLPPGEIIGKRVPDILGDGWPQIQPRLDRALAGERVTYELTMPPVAGSDQSRHFTVTYQPHRDASGEPQVVVVVVDITERRRAEEALQESELRYHTLFDSIDEGFCIIELIFNEADKPVDYRFLEVNAAFERHTGLAAATGKTMRELAPEHEEHWFQIYGHVALTGQPARFQNRAECLRRWFDVYAFSLESQEGRRVAVLFTDITERKRAEAKLARQASEQAALYEFTDKLHRAISLEEIYESALDSIMNALRCDRASLLLFDSAGIMQFVASRGLSEAYRKSVAGHSPWTPDAGDPQPIAINDIETSDIEASLKQTIRDEGIRALAFIPLVVDGKLIGKFMTYYDAPHVFDSAELELALTIARQLGFGVERKRAEAGLRQVAKAAAYRIAFTDVLRPLTDPAQIQSEAARLLGEHLAASRTHYAEIEESGEYAVVAQDHTRNASSQVGRHRLAEYASLVEAILPGHTFVGSNLAEDERSNAIQKAAFASAHVAAMVIVPLIKHSRLVAVLAVQHVTPRFWTTEEVALIEETAERTWAAVERARAEQALRESEERFRTLVEQVKDYAIFRMDTEGRPISWNEGVQRVFGYTEDEFIGKPIAPLIFTPEDVKAGISEMEMQTAVENGTASNDRWLRRKDGSRFFATGVTTGLRNEAGEHIGYSKVLRDETATKRTSDALADARTKLREHAATLEKTVEARTHDLRTANEQLEAFVYSIAHDLRTPLRSMGGFSQILVDEYAPQLDENAQHLLKRIQASSEFMDKLLLDLLAYGRMARSEMELTTVDLKIAWEIALFQCGSQIDQTQALIETVGPLLNVRAHEATLGQCLANLLSNALKFVPPGDRPHVRFWSEPREGYIRMWMEDHGLGIPLDQQERAFRVFERLHGSRYQGTGIGLSIVKKGIERMGGRIGLESEPDKGSRFWIELEKAS